MKTIDLMLTGIILSIFIQGCSGPSSHATSGKVSDPKFSNVNSINEQVKAIQKEVKRFNEIKSPISEAVQLAAVKSDVGIYHYIRNPSPQVETQAMRRALELANQSLNDLNSGLLARENDSIIQVSRILWKTKNESVQLMAIDTSPKLVLAINNPSARVQAQAMRGLLKLGASPTRDTDIKKLLMYTENETVQLMAINENPDFIKHIRYPAASVRKNSKFVAYEKREQKIAAEMSRKIGQSSGTSSSSSNNSQSSYSAPQRKTCSRTVYHTEYAPGNSGRTVQIPSYENYAC